MRLPGIFIPLQALQGWAPTLQRRLAYSSLALNKPGWDGGTRMLTTVRPGRLLSILGTSRMSTGGSFKRLPFSEADTPNVPFPLVDQWVQDAKNASIPLPTVASLASASLPSGRVSSRMVNIREIKSDGSFVLYSDFHDSRKGRDIASNSSVALTFYWQQLDRSLRVEGTISLYSKEQSRAYFDSLPKEFRASVLLGEQSHPVTGGRQPLVEKFQHLNSSQELEIPDYWVGAEIVPDWIEFWQGSDDRVSDRIAYTKESGSWVRNRLSP